MSDEEIREEIRQAEREGKIWFTILVVGGVLTMAAYCSLILCGEW